MFFAVGLLSFIVFSCWKLPPWSVHIVYSLVYNQTGSPVFSKHCLTRTFLTRHYQHIGIWNWPPTRVPTADGCSSPLWTESVGVWPDSRGSRGVFLFGAWSCSGCAKRLWSLVELKKIKTPVTVSSCCSIVSLKDYMCCNFNQEVYGHSLPATIFVMLAEHSGVHDGFSISCFIQWAKVFGISR